MKTLAALALFVALQVPVGARASSDTCILDPIGFPVLVVGAHTVALEARVRSSAQSLAAKDSLRDMTLAQIDSLKAASVSCEAMDTKGIKVSYTLKLAGNDTQVIPVTLDISGSTAIIRASEIPANLATGSHEWNLEPAIPDKWPHLVIDLMTVAAPTVAPLEVVYNDPTLAGLQNVLASNGSDAKPSVAVMNQLWAYRGGLDERVVEAVSNSTTVTLPRYLPAKPSPAQFYWRLESTTWGGEVQFIQCRNNALAAKPLSATMPCNLDDGLGALAFAVKSEHKASALDATVALVRKTPLSGDDVVMMLDLRLATEARRQSQPIDLQNRLYIECDSGKPFRKSYDDGLMSVDDSDLASSRCRLKFSMFGRDPACAKAGTLSPAEEAERDRLVTAGRQTLEVSVSRAGGGNNGVARPLIDVTSIIGANDHTCPHDLVVRPLPMPSQVMQGDGSLFVTISLAANAPEAEYRLPGNKVAADVPAVITSQQFTTQIRPRGPFGLKSSLRIFLTVPANVVGLRLMANPRNLASSSDSKYYELTTIRAGLLLAFEPWNYALGKSAYPVPFRFMTGFNFFNADTSGLKFEPTWVISAFAATLPLFQGDGRTASQIGTSLAVGPSVEMDLRNGSIYVLFNLGFNLFSFLAAK